jgi:hypothetical protein
MQTKTGVRTSDGYLFEAESHDGGVLVSAESPHGDCLHVTLTPLETEDFITALHAALALAEASPTVKRVMKEFDSALDRLKAEH